MKILILQLKRIGDLILTTPVFPLLREHFPNAQLTLVTMETCRGLLPALPDLHHAIVIRRKGSNAGTWANMIVSSYDLCLDFTGNDRSALLTLLSKAPRRLTYQRAGKNPIRPLVYTEFVNASVRENHTVDLHLALLRPLGIAPPASAEAIPFGLKLPLSAHEKASQMLANAGVSGPYLVVHPGTARPEKYWLPERWAAVIDHCQETLGLPCVVTGSPDPLEREHIQAIGARLRSPLRDFSGKMDLLTLGALIERTHLLVSMDSAPVHFGAAFRTRQISLFGQTNPYHWHPRHPGSVVLMAGHDDPVTQFSTHFSRRPLSDLSTETVINAIGSVLKANV